MNDEKEAGASTLNNQRSNYLDLVYDIGRLFTNANDLDDLLKKTAERIQNEFDYYHVAIYIIDRVSQTVGLKGSAGVINFHLYASNIKLQIGQEGMVGYVSRYGEPRVAQDVSSDPFYFVNPTLPDTLSEAALPVRIGKRVLGVLNIHSKEKVGFREESINALQNIADQLAIAIENFNLSREHKAALSELQMTLEAGRKTYSDISHKAWSVYIRTRPEVAFLCDSKDIISPALEKPASIITLTADTGSKILEKELLSLPIKIRDQVIGVVSLRKSEEEKGWTEEEIELMENLVDHLAVALESARLYDDTQKRAERERLISDITSKVRSSTNLDVIMQTAIQQIAEALKAPRGSIILRGED
jgi:GAF domain-containing protein